MKNGKLPTRKQKILMKSHGLQPDNWLVVKDLKDILEVVNRNELKKIGGKVRTRKLSKDIGNAKGDKR